MTIGFPFGTSTTIHLPGFGIINGGVTVGPVTIIFGCVCFASGTLICTTTGDVPVEELKIGDLVVTTSGATRPIKWLGHREIDCLADDGARRPVRISANAFGPNRPDRDLYVSPGHAICVDIAGEVLIPAASLVNGSTIARVETDEVTYWHVELDSHDIIISNGLPSESYIDVGNRAFFVEGGATSDQPDAQPLSLSDYCRPFHAEGVLVEAAKAQLAARATAQGWAVDHDPGLEVVVDGAPAAPLVAGDTAVLVFPADAREVRIASKTFVPADLGSPDSRRLGLNVCGLSISATRGEPRRIPLDEPLLADAFYQVEDLSGQAWRWTKGDIVLPRELWEGLSGQVALHLSYETLTQRGWIAPPPVPVEEPAPMLRIVA